LDKHSISGAQKRLSGAMVRILVVVMGLIRDPRPPHHCLLANGWLHAAPLVARNRLQRSLFGYVINDCMNALCDINVILAFECNASLPFAVGDGVDAVSLCQLHMYTIQSFYQDQLNVGNSAKPFM